MIMSRVVTQEGLAEVSGEHVKKALGELAAASQGAMTISASNVHIHVSQPELERRLVGLTRADNIQPRRASTFRES